MKLNESRRQKLKYKKSRIIQRHSDLLDAKHREPLIVPDWKKERKRKKNKEDSYHHHHHHHNKQKTHTNNNNLGRGTVRSSSYA